MVLHYQFGHAPALPAPDRIDAEVLSETDVIDGLAVKRAVRLRFGPGNAVSLSLGMHLPKKHKGPFPVIVHNSPGTFEVEDAIEEGHPDVDALIAQMEIALYISRAVAMEAILASDDEKDREDGLEKIAEGDEKWAEGKYEDAANKYKQAFEKVE